MKYYCYSMLDLSDSFRAVPNPGHMFRYFKKAAPTWISDSMTTDGQFHFGEATYITTDEPESYFSIIDELPEDAELITLEVLCRERPSGL
jgi:hypothetical protein